MIATASSTIRIESAHAGTDVALSRMLVMGLSAIPAFAINDVIIDRLAKARDQLPVTLNVPYNHGTSQTVVVQQAGEADIALLSELARVFNALNKTQVELDHDAKRILYENLWQLYA